MKLPNPARWSIRWQIAALLIATQLLAHLVTAITVNRAAARNGGETQLFLNLSEPMLTALRMSNSRDTADVRRRFVELSALDGRFVLTERLPIQTGQSANPVLQRAVVRAVPTLWQDQVTIYVAEGGAASFQSFTIAAGLGDGGWLVFAPTRNTLVENVPKLIAFLGLLFFGLPLMLLSVWSGVALVALITALAKGAERFAQDSASPPLPEEGPVEVRRARYAFNQMRLRIQKLLSDRSQTLASIGHDMRTPLTRLRLRLEMLDLHPNTAAREVEADIARGASIELPDDGPGIPLDHRDKVLEPFTRIEAVRAGTAQNAQGFGLGLAIARDLTKRHGGVLTLADNQPCGLLVTIALPKQPVDENGLPAKGRV